MDNIGSIIYVYKELSSSGIDTALATLVNVQGTAFRKLGARMLIGRNGIATGSITAGCIESDIVIKAKELFRNGAPLVLNYDTGGEKEILFGWGSGCDGILTVLLERLDSRGDDAFLNYLSGCRQNRRTGSTATIFQINGESPYYIGQHLVEKDVAALLHASSNQPNAFNAQVISTQIGSAFFEVLVEPVELPRRLVVFGASPIAIPLSTLALQTGWEVSVVDRRQGRPHANGLPPNVNLFCVPYESFADEVELDDSSAIVVATHNFLDDVALIKGALKTDVKTIMVVSSHARAQNILAYIGEDDGKLTDEDRARLFAPAGLNIGGDTPQQIALSILAQLQQVFADAPGGALRVDFAS
jgi:xanthine dehydrogenase accessory factor